MITLQEELLRRPSVKAAVSIQLYNSNSE